jgi:hypothetical protein
VEIRDADNQSIVVAIDEIDTRSPVVTTMPPMFALLNKHEIRDVIAYLVTLQEK